MEHTHLYQHRVKSIAGGDLRPYFSFSYFGIVSSWHWGVPLLMLLCAAVWFSVIIEQCKTQRPLKIYLSDALNAMVVNLDYIMLILLTTIGLFGIFLNMWNKKIDCIRISINCFFSLFLWETNNIILTDYNMQTQIICFRRKSSRNNQKLQWHVCIRILLCVIAWTANK